jgi:hypothetical protein
VKDRESKRACLASKRPALEPIIHRNRFDKLEQARVPWYGFHRSSRFGVWLDFILKES